MEEAIAQSTSFAELALQLRGFQVARMISVAAELGLADRVAGGSRSAMALGLECGADPGMLLRLCRALAAFGIFSVDAEGRIGQSERSAWLRSDATPTLYYAARYWTMPSIWATWGNLEHTIRTGEPAFIATLGMPSFEHLKSNPEDAERFDRFMQHSPDDRHRAVAEAFPLSPGARVVDIGGGNGALVAAVLAANPEAEAVLFDRPDVVAGAPAVLGSLAERCEVRAGDFFGAVPDGGDVYVLCQILHDWSDERCLTILANCRTAMRPGAELMIVERLVGDIPGGVDPINYLADMHMAVLFPGGRERTLREFEDLLRESGFGPPRAIRTRCPYWIIVAAAD
jgi:hypothetical protein